MPARIVVPPGAAQVLYPQGHRQEVKIVVEFAPGGDRIVTGLVVAKTRSTTASQVRWASQPYSDAVWTIATAGQNGLPPLVLIRAAQAGRLRPVGHLGGRVGLYRVGDCLDLMPQGWDPQRVWWRPRDPRGPRTRTLGAAPDVWAREAERHAYQYLYARGYRRGRQHVPHTVRVECVADWLTRHISSGAVVTTALIQRASGLYVGRTASPQASRIAADVSTQYPRLLRREYPQPGAPGRPGHGGRWVRP